MDCQRLCPEYGLGIFLDTAHFHLLMFFVTVNNVKIHGSLTLAG